MNNIDAQELINKFDEQNYYFSKELIFNYYNSMISKPFLILTGISGSGKSKLPQLFSDIISDNDKSKIEIIPVKPNWKDSKGLFGYHNLLDNSYYITPLIKLMLRALADSDNPYFLVLDEMNLAKTEYYFADYLSLIESRKSRIVQEAIDFNNLNDLRSKFTFPQETSLSEAIILSAIDFNTNTFLPVGDYRNHNFSRLWREQFSDVSNENWTPMFRTELNQGEGRLAKRVFESPNGEGRDYRLKSRDLLNPHDAQTMERLETLYKKLRFGAVEIHQDAIALHNSNKCLGICEAENCIEQECQYNNDDKYKCSRLYNPANDSYLVPPKLPIPLNMFTIGTVNIDETTYMFSPKVLDRSNVIEFNNVDFDKLLNLSGDERFREVLDAQTKQIADDNYYFNSDTNLPNIKISIPDTKHTENFKNIYPEGLKDVLKIFNILKSYNMHFGYRTLNELSLYITNVNFNTTYGEKLRIALDLQILQKILPKFHGSYDKLWKPLFEILITCINEIPADFVQEPNYGVETYYKLIRQISGNANGLVNNLSTENYVSSFKYPRSAKKIVSMLKNLEMHGFASYIE
ncbi:MAG: hypothetical protein K0S61_575 [Anaerocolumna sp.]|jgi:energy-coupling factor transporter ATP-binding protein EcfA2|nr:hypothetical protein [Anaerocolumna sp.]